MIHKASVIGILIHSKTTSCDTKHSHRVETRGAPNWATYGMSFFLTTTNTGSQSWWKIHTWCWNI